jgi:hypothetical protein
MNRFQRLPQSGRVFCFVWVAIGLNGLSRRTRLLLYGVWRGVLGSLLVSCLLGF